VGDEDAAIETALAASRLTHITALQANGRKSFPHTLRNKYIAET
jgi:hypothetical protein